MARLEELRATKAELDGLGARLTEEANRLASSLDNLDPRVLLQLQPDGKHLPAEDAARLQRLNSIKEKLSLLPGARANVDRKLEMLVEELEASYQEASGEYRAKARAQFDRELMAEIERNLPRCGGDARRATLAANAALEHCELKRWLQLFSAHRSAGDIVVRINQLLDQVVRFEAGQPVRQGGELRPESASA